jgi:hypothetical protein
MRLEQECKFMNMSIRCNVNVWIWKYNIIGMSIYENYFCRSHDKEGNLITKSQNVIVRIIENKKK